MSDAPAADPSEGPSHRGEVAIAFEALAEGLAPFVDARMRAAFPDEDWIMMAASKLGKRRDVLVSLTDPHFQLEVIARWWGPVFLAVLGASTRDTVTDLRTARNHWAHPDAEHPFDLDYALAVHRWAEDLLERAGSPMADRLVELTEDLRWQSARRHARQRGVTEAEALLGELAELQHEREDLQRQLDEARAAASSAVGRGRAVARQLAELQAQYAAVAGLRDEYRELEQELATERSAREAAQEDTSAVQSQMDDTGAAASDLERQAEDLRLELERARQALAQVDPLDTDAGRRWLWLVSSLIVLLGLLVLMVSTLPR
ncbi:Swt1 family HEPN domain-containing protein [Rhabdothermincola salaria]|uniref:Swt1 family HEPN domain-containing protein n=1 Tax=Rhabdothermincola salaria TaxID=2903142 RepID=UPI001E45DF2E|nr:hypothetical protein [Rhabdothermincola salaria]